MRRRQARKILQAWLDDARDGRACRHRKGSIMAAQRKVAPFGLCRSRGGRIRKLVAVSGVLKPGPVL